MAGMSSDGEFSKKCSIASCTRKHYARTWCKAHYMRWFEGRDMNTPIQAPGKHFYGKCAEHLAPVKSPTTRDLEWSAGFLEGEGHFGKNNASHMVTAGQNEPECLVRLQTLFGGRVYRRKQGNFPVWYVTGARARGVMMTLYTLLSKRRQVQIKEALHGV